MNTPNPHQPTLQSIAEQTVELMPERAESRAHDVQGRLKPLLGMYLRLPPIRAAAEETEHLYELERAGESQWTPWIAIAALVVLFALIGLLMFGVVEAASHLLAAAAAWTPPTL